MVAFHENFFGLRLDDIVRCNAPKNIFPADGNLLNSRCLHLAQHGSSEFFTLFDDELVTFRIAHIRAHFAA